RNSATWAGQVASSWTSGQVRRGVWGAKPPSSKKEADRPSRPSLSLHPPLGVASLVASPESRPQASSPRQLLLAATPLIASGRGAGTRQELPLPVVPSGAASLLLRPFQSAAQAVPGPDGRMARERARGRMRHDPARTARRALLGLVALV